MFMPCKQRSRGESDNKAVVTIGACRAEERRLVPVSCLARLSPDQDTPPWCFREAGERCRGARVSRWCFLFSQIELDALLMP